MGETLALREAKQMDNAELLMHINKHCPNPLTNLLPKEPTTNERAKALKKFIEGIAEEVGGAITTEGALEKALTKINALPETASLCARLLSRYVTLCMRPYSIIR